MRRLGTMPGPRSDALGPGDDERTARLLVTVLVALTYVAVLHYSYQFIISPVFGYAGYEYRSPEPVLYAVAVTASVLVVVAAPRWITRPSEFMTWIICAVAVIPSIIIPQISPALSSEQSIKLGLVVAATFSSVLIANRRAATSVFSPKMRISETSLWLLIIACTTIVYGYLAATVGLSFSALSLLDVYDVRADYKSELATGGGLIAGYLLPLQANVINPMVAVRGIYAGQRWLLAVAAISQYVLYATTGLKTIMFSVPFLILAALLFRGRRRPFGPWIVAGGASISILAVLMDGWLGGTIWTSMAVRRFLLTPGLLTAAYVSTFIDQPKALLGHSVLADLVEYPYTSNPPLIVGDRFFDERDMSANGNVFADGYANFGYAGVAFAAIVLWLILRMVDKASRDIPLGPASLMLLMPTISLANSGALTTLSTHGLAAAIALLAIAPLGGWEGKATRRRTARAQSG